MQNQINRIRILIMARLFIAAFLLFYAQFVFHIERYVFYAIIAIVSLLSAGYVAWVIWGRLLKVLVYFQIVCDLILESILVYYTGGTDSLFVTVYALSILSASSIISPNASFFIAGGSSLFFVGAILAGYHGWIPKGLPLPDGEFSVRRDPIYLFYASYVQITVFFVVAILAYYFSRVIKRLEAKIKTQERLVFLGEVTSSIAHEIRNPLASISGSVELLARQLQEKLNEKQSNLMNAVVDESERIKRIFNGLLDYARFPELKIEDVDLEQFLDQVLMLMTHQHDFSTKVSLHPLYKNKKIHLKIDPEYMKQVFMNIITNAYQAMPDGGSLTIDVNTKHNEAMISIEDTGVGMDKQVLNLVFVPFKTTKTNGAGLGMAQASKIINQHDGRILIHSKPKKGTRVEIIIPIVR